MSTLVNRVRVERGRQRSPKELHPSSARPTARQLPTNRRWPKTFVSSKRRRAATFTFSRSLPQCYETVSNYSNAYRRTQVVPASSQRRYALPSPKATVEAAPISSSHTTGDEFNSLLQPAVPSGHIVVVVVVAAAVAFSSEKPLLMKNVRLRA